MPFSDLRELLDEYGLFSEYADIIRNSNDINDYVSRREKMGSSWLNNIIEKQNFLEIKEDEIPKEIMDKLKSMMSFSLENGAEKIEGIGISNGFYHVHFLVVIFNLSLVI